MAKRTGAAIARVVVYIVIYVVISAVVHYLMSSLLPQYNIQVQSYEGYVQILLALLFGYYIVSGVAEFFYWSMRAKYDHSVAASVRNVVRIIGIGAMLAAIAGAVGGGAAGVALGGFLGIVIGFASQQVLGQAVAGLFLLIARPFKIKDSVNLVGEDGVVEDVSTLFTTVIKSDGTKVLIPNNAIIGNKIYLKPKQQQ
ncbi:Small-conductance mechanosensitive channel-like protein [Thermoproteus uzoniensis 768-20]|uniref:Small-conductance mechanosensitive channel-like protein n=1 Tax=Thermoproteus uzoniensis (strain 768-20) TaxID=999630 RepID=F2L274_THEU7|nr:Small-conductance mechanosensitive channel-like protein [Thermoproteus uzoniensis 768-20]